jgi:hypothetical protein
MAISKTKMKELEKMVKKGKKKVKKAQTIGDDNQAGMHMDRWCKIQAEIDKSLISRP